MQRRYVTVDVFTEQRFGGNPLAVVLDAEGLDTASMQAIAREFNYSETTFVLAASDPAHTTQVRIFTPAYEMPFAGHPNVGTAFVLASEGMQGSRMLFEEIAGIVPVDILRHGDRVVGAELTAPQGLQRLGDVSTEAVAACLSLSPSEVACKAHDPVLASVGAPFVLAELTSRDVLRRAKVDLAAFARAEIRALYVYCRGGDAGFDLHSRMFAPLGSIMEDPATGSATVTLAALLAEAGPDGETTLRLEQGRDMGRPSTLVTRTVKQDGVVRSAHVGGRCVPMMRGMLDA